MSAAVSMASYRKILSRHDRSLRGRLRYRVPYSGVLGIRKPYYVYEPPELDNLDAVATLFLFRGHEREWVNINEDRSRTRTSLEDIDLLIARRKLPPLLVVLPGLSSANNHVPTLGVNMVGNGVQSHAGLGTGRFWDYLDAELIPRVGTDYPQTAGGLVLAAGFSLGGYTVSVLATHRPGFLQHAGIFDGLFMWPENLDPRVPNAKPYCDTIWTRNPLFDAAFGRPRNRAAMAFWNPTEAIVNADRADLEALRKTKFWIKAAPADGGAGNRDRAKYFVSLLRRKGLSVGFTNTTLNSAAAHTWHWSDRFLIEFLTKTLAT